MRTTMRNENAVCPCVSVAQADVEEEKVSGLNGTVEECKVTVERAEVLLTRDQFSGILVVVL